MKLEKFTLGNYTSFGISGGVQTGVPSYQVLGGPSAVSLTSADWAEQGFQREHKATGAVNVRALAQLPMYFQETTPTVGQLGFMPTVGVAFSWVPETPLYSTAYGLAVEAGDRPDGEELDQYFATVSQVFVGPDFGVNLIRQTTIDVSAEEKAVKEAKKAQTKAKKDVADAEGEVKKAKEGLAGPTATLVAKQAAYDSLVEQIGMRAQADEARTGLAGSVQDLELEIEQLNTDIPLMVDNSAQAKAAKAAAVAELATKTQKLQEVKAELATAEEALRLAAIELRVAQEAVRVATIPVTEAEAKLAIANGKVSEADAKVAAAEAAEKAAKEGNDKVGLSRAGLSLAPQWGPTTITPVSSAGVNVNRAYPANAFNPLSTFRFAVEGDVAFNLPTLPFDVTFGASLLFYTNLSETNEAVQITDSDGVVKSYPMTSTDPVHANFTFGIEF